MVDVLGLVFSLGVAIAMMVAIFRVPNLQVEPGEHVVLQSKASLSIDTLLGTTMGSVYLTNRRLVWRSPPWFLRLLSANPPSQSFLLSQITEVTGGSTERGWSWKFSREAIERGMMASTLKFAIEEHQCFVRFQGVNPFRLMRAPKQWESAIRQAPMTAPDSDTMPAQPVLMPSRQWLWFSRAFVLVISAVVAVSSIAAAVITFNAGNTGGAVFSVIFALAGVAFGAFMWQFAKPRGKTQS
jgi:hypothetical protein